MHLWNQDSPPTSAGTIYPPSRHHTPMTQMHHSTLVGLSINSWSFHDIPNKRRSSGCTGTVLKADCRSSFLRSAPLPPRLITFSTIWSTVMYFNEHIGLSIPSFTLLSSGEDRLTISLHFPGWLFGITPNRLICIFLNEHWSNGPSIRPNPISFNWYCSTTNGLSCADCKFLLDGVQL